MALTPETSDFTSIQKRIGSAKEGAITDTLARFQGYERKGKDDGIPFSLKDYIELVDHGAAQVGRAIREDKSGHIDNNFPPILKRLGIETETWLFIATTFEESLGRGRLGVDWHSAKNAAGV